MGMNLGAKHTCNSCHTRFYDLGQTPIVCPKCSHALEDFIVSEQVVSRDAPDLSLLLEEDFLTDDGSAFFEEDEEELVVPDMNDSPFEEETPDPS